MNEIPIPSTVHYEMPLRILEQQTLRATAESPEQRQLAQEMVIALRKVIALHRRLEESCEQEHLALDYRWSVEDTTFDTSKTPSG